MRSLTAFKSYDIRGRLGSDMDSDVAYLDALAHALSAAVTNGVIDAGSNVWRIGLAGTEEMYCATAELDACCGVAITASHNPIDYNGIKLVKSSARPLDQSLDFLQLKQRAQLAKWAHPKKARQGYRPVCRSPKTLYR